MSPTNRPGRGIRQSVWQSPWVNSVGRFAALLLVFCFFAAMVEDGKFYTPRNLESILRQSAVYATAALGMTLVIITAGIDLSVGSVIALAVVVVAWILNLSSQQEVDGTLQTVYWIEQQPTLLPILAVSAGVAAGALAGMLNGCLIVGLKLAPFIVTLGMMGIIRGVAKGIANERDIYPPVDTWVRDLMVPTMTSAERSWMLFPPGVWILIFASAAAALMLRYTRLGRHVFAIGSNEETARLCGVPVERTKIIVYLLAGCFAGVAGLMQFSFINGIGQPTTAVAYELFVIAAVVIGGGSLMGGEGTILGSLIGALIITILYMGGQQMGWPKWVQEIVIGSIIIVAVALDQLRHRRLA